MSEKIKQQSRSSASTSFDDQELRATMDAYLNSEPKPDRSVWNFSTIAGLGMLFIGMSYTAQTMIGHTVGLSIGPDLSTVISILPFIGGGLLAVTGFGLAIRERRKKRRQDTKKKGSRTRMTHDSKRESGTQSGRSGKDRLDDFLYPDNKANEDSSLSSRSDSYAFTLQKKLFRSRTEKKIGGVCGGLATYFDVSPTMVRFIFVLATLLGYGSFILVYIAMMIVVPREPADFLDL